MEEIMEHPFFASIDWEKLYQKRISPPYKPASSKDKTVDVERRMTLADEAYSMMEQSGIMGGAEADDFLNFTYVANKSSKLQ
jgi:serum/glucocorticoid-regulated kinase 2